MKLTCVTAVFNAIKSGNRENLIRCVRSVAALKTEHEHLIYDGGSTDGTVELLRELEAEVRVKSSSSRADEARASVDAGPCPRRDADVANLVGRGQGPASTGGESGALIERALPSGIDRRACAEEKVAEWLAGVDGATFEAALVKLVEEKTASGEYVFEQHEDIAKSIEAAKRFFNGFSRRIVELSDGRCVYFAPDPRSKMRNSDNAVCWAEYAFHSVSSGGDRIPGKNYTYRHYSPYKILNTDLIEPTLRMEKCVPVLKSKSALDAVKFFGTAHLGGLFDVVVRLDEYGNVNANMTEVTFEASTKRGQKKLPQLVSLTEAIRTVVSHQTATGTCPPNEDSIAFCSGENKGGGEKSEKCEVRSEKSGTAEGVESGSLEVWRFGGLARVKSSSSRAEGARSSVDAFVPNASDGSGRSSIDAIGTIASTGGGESGALGERALPRNESSAIHHSPTLRVVSEPDTGIYNALNKGVRDARGEWFYVLGCDDYISRPAVMDRLIATAPSAIDVIATSVVITEDENERIMFSDLSDLQYVFLRTVCCHQGEIMRTKAVRELNGFDERYKIAADTNMFFLARLRGYRFQYVLESFASYTMGGASNIYADIGLKENSEVVSRCLNMNSREIQFYLKHQIVPLALSLRFMWSKDEALRRGARYMFRKWLRFCVHILAYPVLPVYRFFRDL